MARAGRKSPKCRCHRRRTSRGIESAVRNVMNMAAPGWIQCGGRRFGKYDHVIQWTKPQRPTWMDQATYDAIPDTLELREIRSTS